MSMLGGMTSFAEPTSHKEMLMLAGRLVDMHLQEDRNSLDVSDLLRVPLHCKSFIVNKFLEKFRLFGFGYINKTINAVCS